MLSREENRGQELQALAIIFKFFLIWRSFAASPSSPIAGNI